MFKLNINSKKVQKFIEFYWSVIESAQEEKSSSYTHSGTSGVSISAKNI